ncbi:glucosamine-6-phosphate deaminase [Lewinellaceae bacterium SD302]|nr:glucosamine-6-phosphate deaminase [Lewinellaceae bacterium SD302]
MTTNLPKPPKRDLRYQFRDLEKIPVKVWEESAEASAYVAQSIALAIKQKRQENENIILGLATGSSPIQVYNELVRMHREEGLSFQNVITFNLDEYYPMEPTAVQSYVRFMNEYLFDKVDIRPENIHIPDGTLPLEEVEDYCREYDKKIEDYGGIDIQILGIGRTGHIGFNEPGSWLESPTRLVRLDALTRLDATKDFANEEDVPYRAITMGIKPIMQAKVIYLLAWGQHKAPILARALEGEISDQVPATFLQEHPRTRAIVDRAAVEELTRFRVPWKVGLCNWDDDLSYRAVLWLSQQTGVPILKLTNEHYSENGLQELILEKQNSYDLNIEVFNRLQRTITGWPGGKANADDEHRPERALPAKKRVIIFSPHPDDDVISMGATFHRLVEQGHEVHVAYQTSGNIAVHDHDALRFVEFLDEFSASKGQFSDPLIAEVAKKTKKIRKFLEKKNKEKNDLIDIPELRLVKGMIRRGEARAGARAVGLTDEKRFHFLDLPFYESGRSRKKPLGPADVKIVRELIEKVKPHQIFAAGDLADPHGTHRICLNAILLARQELKDQQWMKKDCYLWLYRGAWMEWPIHEIEMAVPFSPDQLRTKRRAIFMHQSQKDRPPFPGQDEREFWVRAEERNRETADIYRGLGLAEYEAMEAFRRMRDL